MSFKKTIDKAIKCLDAERLIKTIENKNGYGLHIIETDCGQRIILTFKGESIHNPHMWLGEPTPANISKAKSLFADFAKSR